MLMWIGAVARGQGRCGVEQPSSGDCASSNCPVLRCARRFAEEYHKLALALNGRVEKHDIPLKCAGGGQAAAAG